MERGEAEFQLIFKGCYNLFIAPLALLKRLQKIWGVESIYFRGLNVIKVDVTPEYVQYDLGSANKKEAITNYIYR